MKGTLTLNELRRIANRMAQNGGKVKKLNIRISSKLDFVDRTLLNAERILRRLKYYSEL